MDRVQFTIDFLFRSSIPVVYQFLTSPANLVRWFCDEVDVTGTTFTYSWDGSEEIAELIEDIENERLRFEWEDADEGEFLEFVIGKSPITGETTLKITGFSDEDDVEDDKNLWESQITKMKKEMGAG